MKPYLLTCLLFFSLLFPIFVFSQDLTISGKVVDTNNQAVSYANIILLKTQDSTIVSGTSTDDNGFFELKNIKPNTYILKVSFIGFLEKSQTITVNADLDLKQIIIEEDTESLEEVNLFFKKPTVKKQADRLVFNVENTALIEGNILQVLKSTPGVLVLDGSIKIKSSTPTVYINNRKVQITADELTQLLENSPANSIKSVEVITNPPASYDAESGSVINIIMSKNLITGYRGSVFTNYTQGVFSRYSVGTNHFFKNKKVSFNFNYNYADSKTNRVNNDVIYFLDNNNSINQTWQSDVNRITKSKTHTIGFNFDYFINDKNTISLSSSSLLLPYFNYKINNSTTILDNNNQFDSRFLAKNVSNDDKYNLGFDLDFVHEFKKSGSLSFNTHYTSYNYKKAQSLNSDFFDNNNVFINSSAFNTNANQDTKIITAKIDFRKPLNESSNFEAGIKFSNINTESDITQFDIDTTTGNQQIDLQNSDIFDYKENIFAAYANYTKDTDIWSLSFGLRTEQTNIDGISKSTNQNNQQNYLKWFPNASIQHNIADGFNLYINYKRSIVRPSYTNLNPFRFFLNENTVVTGNPNLNPTFLDHYVIGTTLFENFTVEAYYQNYDGEIYEIPRQNNTTNVLEYAVVNFDKTVEFGFDFATYLNITDNWFVYAVTSFYNRKEEVDFGTGFVRQDQWSNYSILSNDLSFLKDKSLSFNLTLTWVGKNLQGFQTVEDRLDSNLSMSKTILKKKGVISLTVSDLFNMQDYEISTNYLNQNNSQFVNSDNRFIKFGFRYKFGNTKLETNQHIKDAEERDRLKESDH